jgi:hypothetical protein
MSLRLKLPDGFKLAHDLAFQPDSLAFMVFVKRHILGKRQILVKRHDGSPL